MIRKALFFLLTTLLWSGMAYAEDRLILFSEDVYLEERDDTHLIVRDAGIDAGDCIVYAEYADGDPKSITGEIPDVLVENPKIGSGWMSVVEVLAIAEGICWPQYYSVVIAVTREDKKCAVDFERRLGAPQLSADGKEMAVVEIPEIGDGWMALEEIFARANRICVEQFTKEEITEPKI